MTIALGILASDGLVIAADTEEVIQGYMKKATSKIYVVSHLDNRAKRRNPNLVCGIAGAGTSGYIDALTEELSHLLVSSKKAKLPQDILRAEIGKVVIRFHAQHVIPFAAYPIQERPEVSMLLGLVRGHDRELLVTEKSTVTKPSPYKAIGAGQMTAERLLDKLWDGWIDVRAAKLLAAYVLFHVKDSVPDCGKYSEVVVVKGDVHDSMTQKQLRNLDDLFSALSIIDRAVFHYIAGSRPGEPEPAAKETLSGYFSHARQDMAKILGE